MDPDADTESFLLESFSITRSLSAEGEEFVTFECHDSTGEPMGIVEALHLLEDVKIQLTVELVKAMILESIEDEE